MIHAIEWASRKAKKSDEISCQWSVKNCNSIAAIYHHSDVLVKIVLLALEIEFYSFSIFYCHSGNISREHMRFIFIIFSSPTISRFIPSFFSLSQLNQKNFFFSYMSVCSSILQLNDYLSYRHNINSQSTHSLVSVYSLKGKEKNVNSFRFLEFYKEWVKVEEKVQCIYAYWEEKKGPWTLKKWLVERKQVSFTFLFL